MMPLKEVYNHAMDNGVVGSNPVARTGRFTRSSEDRASLLIQQGANPKYIFRSNSGMVVSKSPWTSMGTSDESVVKSATHAQPAGLGERANAS